MFINIYESLDDFLIHVLLLNVNLLNFSLRPILLKPLNVACPQHIFIN